MHVSRFISTAVAGHTRAAPGRGSTALGQRSSRKSYTWPAPLASAPAECRQADSPGGAAGDAPPAVALADVEVDAVVVGDEGCLGPVGLDEAALRRPVLRRPDAGVGVHGLPRRELGTTLVVVAEHADGGAVDVPPTYHPMDTQQHKLSSDHFLLPVLCSH
jgi:hypothetical protein